MDPKETPVGTSSLSLCTSWETFTSYVILSTQAEAFHPFWHREQYMQENQHNSSLLFCRTPYHSSKRCSFAKYMMGLRKTEFRILFWWFAYLLFNFPFLYILIHCRAHPQWPSNSVVSCSIFHEWNLQLYQKERLETRALTIQRNWTSRVKTMVFWLLLWVELKIKSMSSQFTVLALLTHTLLIARRNQKQRKEDARFAACEWRRNSNVEMHGNKAGFD